MLVPVTTGKVQISFGVNEPLKNFFYALNDLDFDQVKSLAKVSDPNDRAKRLHWFETVLAIFNLSEALDKTDPTCPGTGSVPLGKCFSFVGHVSCFPFEALRAVIEDENVERVEFAMETKYKEA